MYLKDIIRGGVDMFCSECGTEIKEGAKFCYNCGAKLTGKFCSNCGAKVE